MPTPFQNSTTLHPNVTAEQPVQIGNYVLPFGPKLVQVDRVARQAIQKGTGATFIWRYGPEPLKYTLEGWSTINNFIDYDAIAGDIQQVQLILQQFPDDGPPQKLLVPSLGIADTVILTASTVKQDTESAPYDPTYHLEFLAADDTDVT